MAEQTEMSAGEARSHRLRWLVFSISGLILIGAGVSITGEAIIRKGSGAPWFALGTLGLVVLNSGVSFVGQGVIHRVRERVGR
jgi:hypothetical protein